MPEVTWDIQETKPNNVVWDVKEPSGITWDIPEKREPYRPWEHPVKEGLKGVGKEALQSFTPENIRKNILAAGEAAGSLATGMAGFVAGVPPLVFGGPKYGQKAAEKVGEAVTYQPKTEQGKQLTGIVSKPFELLTMGEDKFAEWAMSQYKTLEETEKEIGDKELAQILHNADLSPKTREWMARSIFRVGLLGLPLLKKVFGRTITPAEAVKETIKNPEMAKELKIEAPPVEIIKPIEPVKPVGEVKAQAPQQPIEKGIVIEHPSLTKAKIELEKRLKEIDESPLYDPKLYGDETAGYIVPEELKIQKKEAIRRRLSILKDIEKEIDEKGYWTQFMTGEKKTLNDALEILNIKVRPITKQAPRPEAPKQPELQTPTGGKESNLAIRAEADAIEAKLTEDFGQLVEYKTMNMKKQANDMQAVMDLDYGQAKRMAMGEIPPPQGIREATAYEAVKIRALKEGDVETLHKLATQSTVPTRLSEYGQAIKAADSRLMEDPVKAAQDVTKTRTEKIKKTTGKTPKKQSAELEILNKKLEETQRSLDDHITQNHDIKTGKSIDEIILPKEKPPFEKGSYGSKNKIVTKEDYLKTKDELRKKFGTQLSVGIDPTSVTQLSKIGTYHFEAGLREFKSWSTVMAKDLGEWVRPHLVKIWESTKSTFHGASIKNISERISDSFKREQDLSEVGRHVQNLAKHFVAMGIKDRNLLIREVHSVLKEIMPDITVRETMDAISGYGKYKLLSKDEIDVQLRDLKGQMQQVAKLEDLQSKKPPLKTGVERRTPSDIERQLIKQVDEAKKKYGIQAIDREKQLKSSLDAVKTRLSNQITDLETQIASKQKIVKTKFGITYDKEANVLKAKRDALKVVFEKIFGKNKMTEAQRIKMAINSVKKSIDEYSKRIANKDISPLTKKVSIHSVELDKLRIEREKLRSQFQELRNLANPKKTPEQIALQTLKTRLRNETNKLNNKLQNLDFSPKEKKITPLDSEAIKLKAEHERVKNAHDAVAKSSGTITKEEMSNLVLLSKQTAEAKTIMEQGGSRFDYGAARVAYENYVGELQGAKEPIKTLISERLKEAKTTWKENKAGAVWDIIKDTIQTISDSSIGLVASVDNSFLGRQGLKTLMTHPSAWYPAAKKSFVDFAKTIKGGKNANDALMADVYSRPNYLNGEYQQAKILVKLEEQYPSTLPERIPVLGRVFKASEYAFTGSAIRMRTSLYDMLSKQAKENGVKWNKTQIEDIGTLINSLTARGKWGKTGEPGIVRLILWAPKMLKANIDVLTAHGLGSGLTTSFARKQAGFNLLKIAGETATIMMIANALKPGSAELDPRSSSFGKIRIGNSLFDITGGAASIVTLATRIITRESKSTRTGIVKPYGIGYGKRSPFDALIDFLVNKTTPPTRVLVDWLRGKTWKGNRFKWGGAAYQAITPISIQQAVELKDDFSADRVAGVIADGVGVNATNIPTFNEQIEQRINRRIMNLEQQ